MQFQSEAPRLPLSDHCYSTLSRQENAHVNVRHDKSFVLFLKRACSLIASVKTIPKSPLYTKIGGSSDMLQSAAQFDIKGWVGNETENGQVPNRGGEKRENKTEEMEDWSTWKIMNMWYTNRLERKWQPGKAVGNTAYVPDQVNYYRHIARMDTWSTFQCTLETNNKAKGAAPSRPSNTQHDPKLLFRLWCKTTLSTIRLRWRKPNKRWMWPGSNGKAHIKFWNWLVTTDSLNVWHENQLQNQLCCK